MQQSIACFGILTAASWLWCAGHVLCATPYSCVQLNRVSNIPLRGNLKITGDRKQKEIPIRPPADYPWTAEQIQYLADNYRIFALSNLDEMREEIARLNPRMIFLTYMASTYLKSGQEGIPPFPEIERFRFYFAYTPAAVLRQGIGAETVRFSVNPYEGAHAYRQLQLDGEANEYRIPIFASTASGTMSKSSHEFVFWLRVGNELMKVVDWNPDTRELEVIRSFDNTRATPHAKGSVLCSPIYYGSKSGKPIPGDRNSLDYMIDKRAESEPILKLKAEQAVYLIKRDQSAGVRMDTMTADLPMHQMGDAQGQQAVPWNFDKNEPYSMYDWVTGYDRQIGYMRRYIRQKIGRNPIICANGVRYDSYGKDNGYCERLLIPTELKPEPIDGYITEKGFQAVGDQFPGQFALAQSAAQKNQNVHMGFGVAHHKSKAQFDRASHYVAAFYYLIMEKGNQNLMCTITPIGFWGDEGGIGSYIWKDPTYDSTDPRCRSRKLGLPPDFFLPIGDPLETAAPGDLDAYRYKDTNVFTRRFTNGIALINPTGTGFKEAEQSVDADLNALLESQAEGSFNLPQTVDVRLDREYLDPETGERVTNIVMRPSTGKTLLIRPGPER